MGFLFFCRFDVWIETLRADLLGHYAFAIDSLRSYAWVAASVHVRAPILLIPYDRPATCSILDGVVDHGHLCQASATTHSLTRLDNMVTELALVGHAQRTSPLFLLNRLKLMVLIHVHIEWFAEADPLTVTYSLFDPTIIFLICVFQWQVLLFKDMFSSGVISVLAGHTELVKSANIAFINHFWPLSSLFIRLIFPEVDIWWIALEWYWFTMMCRGERWVALGRVEVSFKIIRLILCSMVPAGCFDSM